MTQQQLDTWMQQLKFAWETKDPIAASELCAPNVLYYETPFDEPLKTRQEVLEIWQEVPQTQKDISFSYDIVSVNEEVGIAHWSAKFMRVPSEEKVHLDGIFVVKLNKENVCEEFHQWWNVKS